MNEKNKSINNMKENNAGSFSKSILKTLSILEQYASYDELGIKEISENTKLPASTVQRIVNTLVMKQFLIQNPNTLKYKLGIAFFNICSHYSKNKDWVKMAKSHMEYQTQRTGETVNLAILQGKNVVYLDKVDSPHILRPNFNVGTPYPAVNTSLGRCLLAYQPWNKVQQLLLNENMSEEEIYHYKEMLLKIEIQGYAVEDEEFQPGLFCIAAPIWDSNNQVIAAISTSIPKIRINDEKRTILIDQMKETASEISLELIKK